MFFFSPSLRTVSCSLFISLSFSLSLVPFLCYFRIMTFSIQQAKRFYYRLAVLPLCCKGPLYKTHSPNVGIINDALPSTESSHIYVRLCVCVRYACLLTSPGHTTGCYNNFLHFVPPLPGHARIRHVHTHTRARTQKATLLIIAVYPILKPRDLLTPDTTSTAYTTR